MDREGHYPQTPFTLHYSNETQITLHFFQGQISAMPEIRADFFLDNNQDWTMFVTFIIFLNVLLLWFPADQGLKKKILFLKLVIISYDSEYTEKFTLGSNW